MCSPNFCDSNDIILEVCKFYLKLKEYRLKVISDVLIDININKKVFCLKHQIIG